MKKKTLGIFALALAIGLSAFTGTEKRIPDNQTVYEWHKYNNAGTAELFPAVIFTGTESEARTAFTCETPGSKVCGRAYEIEGSALDLYIDKP